MIFSPTIITECKILPRVIKTPIPRNITQTMTRDLSAVDVALDRDTTIGKFYFETSDNSTKSKTTNAFLS